jgi:hypothetical protein
MVSDGEKLENGTPVLETVELPPVDYSPESEEFIASLEYRFPRSACCGH